MTIFKKLLHDRDMEVKSIAIQKIPEVAIHISKNLFEQNIYSEFDEFLKDPQYVLFLLSMWDPLWEVLCHKSTTELARTPKKIVTLSWSNDCLTIRFLMLNKAFWVFYLIWLKLWVKLFSYKILCLSSLISLMILIGGNNSILISF